MQSEFHVQGKDRRLELGAVRPTRTVLLEGSPTCLDILAIANEGVDPMDIKGLRDRLAIYLSPDIARAAGMSLDELQQFCAGHFMPHPESLQRLARLMKFEERKSHD